MTGEHRAETYGAYLRRLRRRALADRLRLYATRPPRRRTLRDLAVEAVVALVVAMALVVGLVLMSGRDAPSPAADTSQGRADERLHDVTQALTQAHGCVPVVPGRAPAVVPASAVVFDGVRLSVRPVRAGRLPGGAVAWCGGAR